MGTIKTIYVCNHTHTDIGFTDYQDVCFRQHARVHRPGARPDRGDRRLSRRGAIQVDLRDHRAAAALSPPGVARRRSTASGTGTGKGRIDVAAMQYNLTPLLNVEQMHRTLYPLRALRDEFGLTVESAMQDDVNGVSWLFADLLADARRLVLHRRDQSDPRRAAEAVPRRLLVGGAERQGSARLERLPLPLRPQPGGPRQFRPGRPAAAALGRSSSRPTRATPTISSTANRRIRCGSTTARPTRACRTSSSAGTARTGPYKFQFVTTTEFGKLLRPAHGNAIGTQRGDWTDHWTDGPGSSAYETGVNRATHEILGAAEAIEAWLRAKGERHWDAARAADTYENATLFDEHTWGAYSSIEAPDSLFTRAQWNRKAGFAYTAAMEAHDQLARAANALAEAARHARARRASSTSATSSRRRRSSRPASTRCWSSTRCRGSGRSWSRSRSRAAARRRSASSTASSTAAAAGAARGRSRRSGGSPAPCRRWATPSSRSRHPTRPTSRSRRAIENRHYRVTVDPEGGGLLEFFDKELGHDFAGDVPGLAPGPIRLRDGRLAGRAPRHRQLSTSRIPTSSSAARIRRGRRTRDKVTVGDPKIDEGRAVNLLRHRRARRPSAPASPTRSMPARNRVASTGRSTSSTTTTRRRCSSPSRSSSTAPDFTIDLNGIPAKPNDDQLDGAAKDWYPLQRWVDVSDGKRGVTLVPLDAPLVHLGGITTGKWSRTLEPGGPDDHVVGDQQSLAGQLQGEPGRRHAAPLPADHACRRRRSCRRGTLCRRGRGAADRAPRHRPTGARSGSVLRRRSDRRSWSPPSPAKTQAGSRFASRTCRGAKATPTVTFTKAPNAARRSDPIEHPGDGARASTAEARRRSRSARDSHRAREVRSREAEGVPASRPGQAGTATNAIAIGAKAEMQDDQENRPRGGAAALAAARRSPRRRLLSRQGQLAGRLPERPQQARRRRREGGALCRHSTYQAAVRASLRTPIAPPASSPGGRATA